MAANSSHPDPVVQIPLQIAETRAEALQEAVNWIIDAEPDYDSANSQIIFRILKGLRDTIFDLTIKS